MFELDNVKNEYCRKFDFKISFDCMIMHACMHGWMDGWICVCARRWKQETCVKPPVSAGDVFPISDGLHRGRSWSRCWGLAEFPAESHGYKVGDTSWVTIKINKLGNSWKTWHPSLTSLSLWNLRNWCWKSQNSQRHFSSLKRLASGRSVARWYSSSLGQLCKGTGWKMTKNDKTLFQIWGMFFLNELQLRWGCNIVVSLKSHRFLGAFPHLPPQQTLALADTFRTCSSRCKRLVARSEFKVRPGESICAYWTRWAEWCGSSLIAHNRSAAACLQHFNAFHAIFSNPWKSKQVKT